MKPSHFQDSVSNAEVGHFQGFKDLPKNPILDFSTLLSIAETESNKSKLPCHHFGRICVSIKICSNHFDW